MNYVLYNPLASAGKGKENFEAAKPDIEKLFQEYTPVNLEEYKKEEFFPSLRSEDKVLVLGGDGTLNVFANNIKNYNVDCDLYYYKGGNGNDFLEDVKEAPDQKLVHLTPYFKRLPKITVNGMTRYYINGINMEIIDKALLKSNDQYNEYISYTFEVI